MSLRTASIRAALAALALLTAPVLAQTPAPEAPEAPEAAPAAEAPAANTAEASSEDELMAESATPPPGFTGIYGQVSDAQTKETLIEATVKVVAGAQTSALTDVDGNYRLALPPGKYDLRVFYDVYEGRRITGVVVEQGKATKLDVQLSADAGAVQEVVVEARADRRAEGALLQERKKAAVVSDAISSQEIARTPDSSASDAVKRVVSATVVDGRFLLLRGLGGRYSVTLLNGALLPSPEPDEPSVPLDIFPTNLLANLNVVKSYTPDLPGTFGGGALLIETNSYPSKFELKPRITLAGNSETNFRQRNTQPGSFVELFGFPGADRRLPGKVPTDGPLQSSQSVEAGRSFSDIWSARRQSSLPAVGLGASMGDTLRFGNQRLGYLASVNYGRRENVQLADTQDMYEESPGVYQSMDPARTELGSDTVSLNGLLNASYQFSRDNELTLFSLYTRGTESRTQTVAGFSQNDESDFEGTRLQFVSRALSFNQLRGFHRLSILNEAELDWQANYSRVDRSEPDTRDTTYYVREGVRYFRDQSGSGDRFFADLAEQSTGATVNLTIPLPGVKLKVGGLGQLSFRNFNSRRFRFDYLSGSGNPNAVQLPPEELFSADYIGRNVRVYEDTRLEDGYDARLGIYSGYALADAQPLEKLRLVGGLRYELSQQTLTAKSRYNTTSARAKVGNNNYSDLLPSANAIYALAPDINLRAGYSYTLARPTFRELAPFSFYDFVRRRSMTGNENLVETRVHNGDLRAEWFAGENEVLAASLFAKHFDKPIERVIATVSGGDITFQNADAATAYGLELEARTSLGRLTPVLSDFRVAGNLTLIRSQVILGAGAQGSATSTQRPLQGQSPYVVNINLGYERRESGTEVALLYNVYGERISEAGITPLPDVYERPFHRVDLAVSQKLGGNFNLKLTGSNLLNSSVVLRQGGLDLVKFRPGVAFSAQLGWSL